MKRTTRVSATDPSVLRLLTEGQIRPLGLMPNASNFTFLVEVTTEGERSLAVYKPRDGEAPLWDFPEGTLCRREVAAYVLARELGWPAIPPTVLRDGPHGLGSVQLFVDASPREHFFTLRERCPEEFMRVAAFDVLANNADRKSGHCLLGADGTIWVVDHGVCFSTDPKLRTVIWDFAGDAVPSELEGDVRRIAEALRSGELSGELAGLLTRAEVEATARRADRLVRTGRFPLPTGRRPYPWPPI